MATEFPKSEVTHVPCDRPTQQPVETIQEIKEKQAEVLSELLESLIKLHYEQYQYIPIYKPQ